MIKEKISVDEVIVSYQKMVNSVLNRFCAKQGLGVFGFMNTNRDIICFSPDLSMCFKDVFLDLELHIEKGIAVRYMQGFDLDLEDAQINKALSYKEYLDSKKLI
jgi:hypothetical protein